MTDDSARQQAIQRLHQRRGFTNYIIGAVVISLFMVLIWALSGRGYFWPVWVVLGRGLATAGMAWSAYGPREKTPSDAEVEEEARKFEDR